MKMTAPRGAWQRAERMLTDLARHANDADDRAFEDRLPYVLDLLAGVRRQIDQCITQRKDGSAEVDLWWAAEKTADRKAINDMRNAQLKRLERGSERRQQTHTNVSAGTFNGHPINSGDTISWYGWRFTSGRFVGKEVLSILLAELQDLEDLIETAESRLTKSEH